MVTERQMRATYVEFARGRDFEEEPLIVFDTPIGKVDFFRYGIDAAVQIRGQHWGTGFEAIVDHDYPKDVFIGQPQKKTATDLTIFTAATGDLYEAYAAPYAVAALISNPTASVEILLPTGYHDRRGASANVVSNLFPGRVLFREHDFNGVSGSVARFVVEPITHNQYLYIGDIDVLMVQSALDKHLEPMRRNGMRYSNNVRPTMAGHAPKMTGLHFTEFDFHHPVHLPRDIDLSNRAYGFDEDLLYTLVSSKAEPKVDYDYRPTLGYHISPHGWPLHPSRGWGLDREEYREGLDLLLSSPEWRAAKDTFDEKFTLMFDLMMLSFKAMDIYTREELRRIFVLRGQS